MLNEKIIWPPSLSPPLLEDGDEMEDSAITKSDCYSLTIALYSSQDKYIQFKRQDNGAHDQLPSLSRSYQTDKVQNYRFQTQPFFETPVSLLILQYLDQLTQSKI